MPLNGLNWTLDWERHTFYPHRPEDMPRPASSVLALKAVGRGLAYQDAQRRVSGRPSAISSRSCP